MVSWNEELMETERIERIDCGEISDVISANGDVPAWFVRLWLPTIANVSKV